MANQKLTDLTSATTPLSGSEQVYVVQSGASKKTTAQQLANLSPGTDLSYTASTRVLASSTGADATLPVATTSDAGLLAAADKTKLDGLATVATSGSYADLSNKPTLGTAAATDATAYATAAQGAKADTAVQPAGLSGYVQTGDSRLSDSREWSADTITQAEAEAGTATTRRAFTAARVFQAIAAWWAASSAKTKLDGIASGATANSSDATLLARANHTGTQPASTISDFTSTARGAISASGSLSYNSTTGVLSYTAPTPFDPASPGAIGGTTPAAGSFTALTASTRLGLPSGAPASPAARDLYAVADTLRYRDSGGGERLLLNASDNLANLASAATARTNLGLGSAATAANGDFLPTTFTAGTISYAATTDLDMAALAGGYRTISLTGNITFTTSNRASGRTVVIRLICDSTQRTLTFPAGWVFVGSKPANIAASKTAVLSLTFFGSADTDCVAAYGVQA